MTAVQSTKARRWADFLLDTRGEIFSVTFKKKDGTMRRLVGRLGVTKGVRDPGRFAAQDKKNAVQRVYDFQKQAFRTIPLARISKVIWRGQTW
jgi:hypothetical protein